MKSLTDCVNFIDSMIFCSIEKHAGIRISENVGDSMVGMYNEKYIEEMVAMLSIFSQINPIIKKFCLDNESDIKNQYCSSRKRIIAWLELRNRELEVDDHQ